MSETKESFSLQLEVETKWESEFVSKHNCKCARSRCAVKQSYKSFSTEPQRGVDYEGKEWVGFDYSAIEGAEVLKEPSGKYFVEAFVYTAKNIALKMVKAALQLGPEKVKAYTMHENEVKDREIGRTLNIDHKTASRWIEEVQYAIEAVFPIGARSRPSRNENQS